MQKPRLHSGVALLLALTGATIALIAIVPHMAHSQGLFLPSIGGSVLFVFALTDTPAAQPRALWVGHLGSAAIGILFLQAFGPGPTTMIVATVATIGFMVISRCVHPPAGANALAVIYSGAGWYSVIDPIGISLAILTIVGLLWSRIGAIRRYPNAWMARSPPD